MKFAFVGLLVHLLHCACAGGPVYVMQVPRKGCIHRCECMSDCVHVCVHLYIYIYSVYIYIQYTFPCVYVYV